MKQLLTILLLFLSLNCFSMRVKHVPVKAKDYITKNYPEAKKIKWSKLLFDHAIIADFYVNSKDVSVVFDDNGHWLESQEQISESELPMHIKEQIPPGVKFQYVMVVKSYGSLEYYIDTSTKNKKSVEYYFSETGELIEVHKNGSTQYSIAIISLMIFLFLLNPK